MLKQLPALCMLLCGSLLAMAASAEDRAGPASPQPPLPAAAAQLYAIEIRIGPEWDSARSPDQQAFFREHSANLRRLRDSGRLVFGARYGEVGLVVLSATSLEDARAMMDADPAMQAGVFTYEAHVFNVFYPGTVEAVD
jgi:uncharacterized protein YciI